MEWVDPLIQLVTSGGFGALLWWILVRYIPALEERHNSRIELIERRHADERLAADQRHATERGLLLQHLEERDHELMRSMEAIVKPLTEAINQHFRRQ